VKQDKKEHYKLYMILEDSPNTVLGAGRMKLFCPSVMMHCSSQPAKKKKISVG
jgi:hypothetical protein